MTFRVSARSDETLDTLLLKRRHLIVATGAAALTGMAIDGPLAQTTGAKRLGVLSIVRAADPGYLEGQMKARGWEPGKDLIIIRRFAEGDPARFPTLAGELVSERVDVMLVVGDTAAVAAANASSSIPIVMQGSAPVELGLAKSLARPGGNVTGVVYQSGVGKQLDLLRALQPGLKRVGFSVDTTGPAGQLALRSWTEAADRVGIAVTAVPHAFVLADLDETLKAAERARVQVLRFGTNPALRGAGWQRIRAWAVPNKVVTTAPPEFREMALGFGTSMEHFNKLWFDLLDRVLRGANPADTPIQQPTNFEIVINRGQLREMGLTVPQVVLLQATQVID